MYSIAHVFNQCLSTIYTEDAFANLIPLVNIQTLNLAHATGR